MVDTCFYVWSCPWRRHAQVLYLCTCGTVGLYFFFWCAEGGIGADPSGMMWGALWCGRLCACTGW